MDEIENYEIECFPSVAFTAKRNEQNRVLNSIVSANDLDLNWLKNNHEMIHFFGLGFIQLKINSSFRIHFYSPKLPSIIGDEDFHNHRYDFVSRILKGHFSQEIAEIAERIDGNTHVMEDESCQKDNKIKTERKSCSIKTIEKNFFRQGEFYSLKHNQFHRVKNPIDNCITLLCRGKYQKEFAQVIRPIDVIGVCPFSKKIEEKELWEIIEEMLFPTTDYVL